MKTPEDPAAGRPPTLVGEAAELADQDAALKAALPRLRLPPKRKGAVRLPPKREGPLLPRLENKVCKCPYCGERVPWPPAELKCPACGKTLRPPPGFGPGDREERRAAKEKIVEARDQALRKMGRRAGVGDSNRGALVVVAAFLLLVGLALVSASRHAVDLSRGGRTQYEWTTNAVDTMCMALEHFRIDVGRYPTHQEGGLLALRNDVGAPNWCGPYVKKLMNDGWNRPFFYDCSNGVPIFLSAGADRTFLTGDDIVARPEQFRPHPDFVPHDPARPAVPHATSVGIGRPGPAAAVPAENDLP